MGKQEFVIAGFGGQGVLFTGKVIAHAGLIENKEVSWLPSYGPEMRGGTANCSICLSDTPIGSPLVAEPDVLIVMNAPSYDKFIGSVAKGGKVILDSSLIQAELTRKDVEYYPVDATNIANNEGISGLGNIILLGKALKETAFSTLDITIKALKECISEGKEYLLESNKKALEIGMSL